MLPTRVGMNRSSSSSTTTPQNAPHACGDEPYGGNPDRLVMDLDPDEALPWARVCDGAETLRDRMRAMGFEVFLRTTGGKGLHLVVALAGGQPWPLVKGFAEALSRAMAAEAPGLFTAVSSKERRKGRIYLDYLRNARGATAVAPYSSRARPGAPVATPLAWDELTPKTKPAEFTVRTLPD